MYVPYQLSRHCYPNDAAGLVSCCVVAIVAGHWVCLEFRCKEAWAYLKMARLSPIWHLCLVRTAAACDWLSKVALTNKVFSFKGLRHICPVSSSPCALLRVMQ